MDADSGSEKLEVRRGARRARRHEVPPTGRIGSIRVGVLLVFAGGLVAACGEDLATEQARCLQGDAGRCYRVAIRYADGDGVKADPALHLEWMARAADLGHPVAEVVVARAYEKGAPGFERSTREAYFWYRLADAQGNGEGADGVRRLTLSLSRDEVAELEERLEGWKPGLTGSRASAPE